MQHIFLQEKNVPKTCFFNTQKIAICFQPTCCTLWCLDEIEKYMFFLINKTVYSPHFLIQVILGMEQGYGPQQNTHAQSSHYTKAKLYRIYVEPLQRCLRVRNGWMDESSSWYNKFWATSPSAMLVFSKRHSLFKSVQVYYIYFLYFQCWVSS